MPKESARDRILCTASRLFHQRGYSEVGINEIIEESGTAKATFYHHFPSKEKLCQTWLNAIHERSEATRRELLEAPGDPVDKVATYFEKLGEYLCQSHYRGCPYTNTATVVALEASPLAGAIQTHKLSIRAFFLELAKAITPDEKRAQNLGDALFLLYSGATTETQNLQNLWPVEAAKATALELCQKYQN